MGAALALSLCQGGAAQAGPSASGDVRRTLKVGPLVREYQLHVPPSYHGMKSAPLVLVFHGFFEDTAAMAEETGFDRLADRDGALVVYPSSIGRPWNDGRGPSVLAPRLFDDVGFISALIDELERDYAVDRSRVYATGMSNGAMFVQRLGCELSAKVAAIAPVAGTMPQPIADRCAPSEPVSVIEFHGTRDAYVPWHGGSVRGLGGRVLSVPRTVARWMELDGCSPAARITEEPEGEASDHPRVRRAIRGPCHNGTEVALFSIEGGGHSWPGQPGRFLFSAVSRDIRASERIWDFFLQHPKPTVRASQ